MVLQGKHRSLALDKPALMGIVNVTPDSFSDGGQYNTRDAAVARALALVEQGARVIDIGGESTRPGADPVSAEDELNRVVPVIKQLRAQSDVFISIDTIKPEVMAAACEAGADMINDILALQAPGALDVAQQAQAAVCVMHMQGTPRSMQKHPHYDDVVAEVGEFLTRRVNACLEAGIRREAISIDPGFGFGKTLDHNLTLLRDLDQLKPAGYPVLIGVSRKSMFAKLYDDGSPQARLNGSLAASALAVDKGAHIVRTHDVLPTRYSMQLSHALHSLAS